ncbi:hypothetical protein PL11201_660093 [Planktothrix sp. PCC 11201]|uniref:hypothetical protein n=1 Tax=Planktothrix sp. PCC 11201 TaxID=1729650 RepID=UPI0009139165|nr:hypothetical protein [Planktothrix sp. PCC 11201]SKB11169.1 hypothetical protein PL11201_100003 [Planktothrix sp. PCC 11201]SKB14550.1 hypothetical protein PL11201_660093 [Planktothrix sp. PCC 11201]
MKKPLEAIEIVNLDHLGIVASVIDEMELVEEVNKYYQAGTTKLFTAIALKAAQKFQVERESVHLDSSSISVEGEYKSKEEENQEIVFVSV